MQINYVFSAAAHSKKNHEYSEERGQPSELNLIIRGNKNLFASKSPSKQHQRAGQKVV